MFGKFQTRAAGSWYVGFPWPSVCVYVCVYVRVCVHVYVRVSVFSDAAFFAHIYTRCTESSFLVHSPFCFGFDFGGVIFGPLSLSLLSAAPSGVFCERVVQSV